MRALGGAGRRRSWVGRMPERSQFLQICPVSGKPKIPMVCADFEKIFAFIDEFRKSGSSDIVKKHLKEPMTPEEQLVFEQFGANVRLLS